MRMRLLLPLVLLPCLVHAMWDTQTLNLQAGHNAVVLRVTPADTLCSEVFKGCDLEEVTWWNRDRRDDGSGIAPTAEMLIWYPESTGHGGASTFNRVLGGHTYIIKANAACELTIVGVPTKANSTVWFGEPNLTGLNLPSSVSQLYFSDYFAGLEGHLVGDSVSVVAANGNAVVWPSSSPVRASDEAVWFTPTGSGKADYMGPLYVSVDTAENAILFNSNTETRRITVKNVTTKDRTLKFRMLASATPPVGQGTNLGLARLMREEIDWTPGYPRRTFVSSDLNFTTNLAAGATFELAVRPDLDRMPAANDGAYMGILEISDEGTTIGGLVPAGGTCRHRIGISCNAALAGVKDPAGLWVGTVTITGVNHARQLASAESEWDDTKIEPVNEPFSFRLVVHVDASGVARLLKEVFVATEADVDSTPTLLVSRDEAINYRNSHTKAKIRRISSANFPNFGEPKAFSGTGFAHGGTNTLEHLSQEFDDKTNPFVHAYHPQHDNVWFRNKVMHRYTVDPAAETDGTGTFESWPVRRTITLQFAETDPLGGGSYDWNRTVTGGTYKETVSSLIKTPIYAEGMFRLTKVVDTHILTGL